MPISALVTSTMPNRASCGCPKARITASSTPRIRLNLVKMFARKISATDRLVRSPPAFVSPRERRSATWTLLNPAGGVNAIGAADASGAEAAASAMPDHSTAEDSQYGGRRARPVPAVPAKMITGNPGRAHAKISQRASHHPPLRRERARAASARTAG